MPNHVCVKIHTALETTVPAEIVAPIDITPGAHCIPTSEEELLSESEGEYIL